MTDHTEWKRAIADMEYWGRWYYRLGFIVWVFLALSLFLSGLSFWLGR